MKTAKRAASTLVAAGLVVLGLAAPALAGSKTSHMTDWHDGDASSSWSGTRNHKTSVAFDSCTREFRATIRRTMTARPDPKVADEWINCQSYADAVRSDTLTASGKYHFDVSGMGFAWCASGECQYNLTSVPKLSIYW